MGTKLRRKLIATTVAVLTVLNFLIIPVSAAGTQVNAGTWDAIRNAVSRYSACEITLTADITLSATDTAISIGSGKDVTLDLNNHTIRRNCTENNRTDYSFFEVSGNNATNHGKFTLTDTSTAKGGKLTGAYSNQFTSNWGQITARAPGVIVRSYGQFIMDGGAISGNTAYGGDGGAVYVEGRGSFEMNGGVIEDNNVIRVNNNYGRGAAVCLNYASYTTNGSTFTMNGGTIRNNGSDTTYRGGAVQVNRYCTFTMNGGEISGNAANNTTGQGGAIYTEGTVTIKDGKISNCSAKANGQLIYIGNNSSLTIEGGLLSDVETGEAVYLTNGRTFTMNGGTITGCKNGSAVNIYNGTFTMNGGELKGNTASQGGGVFLRNSTNAIMNLNGGSITGNTGSGIYLADNSSVLNLGGTGVITVTDNQDSSGNASDIYLNGNSTRVRFGNAAIATGSQIGIRSSNTENDITVTNGYSSNNSATVPNTIFLDNSGDYYIVLDNSEVHFKKCDPHAWGEPNYVWSDDHSTCTATKICANNEDHVETETVAAVSEVTKEATCTAKGETTYTATFTKEGFAEQVETVADIDIVDDAHSWGDWAVLDENQHQRVCANDPTHVEKEDHNWDEGEITTAATCDDAGVKTFTCTVCGATKTEEVEAIGHKWADATYKWAEDHSTCTATKVCENDPNHVETETVAADSEVTKEATCTTKGETTYTATFTKEGFAEQVETIADIDIVDDAHSWGDWAVLDENQHQRVCANDPTHVEKEDHNWDEGEITTPATCETAGVMTYTCEVCGATKTEEIKATGHAWGAPSYEWTQDGDDWKCTATRVCANDASHVETETVTATHKTTTVATCEETGVETYTATFENTAFEAKTKEIEISALGHDYGAWTELDDNQHQRVCANDPTHVEKEDHNWNAGEITTPATCETAGIMTYTCEVCGATKTEEIKATGHAWGAPSYEWTQDGDDWKCTATRVCANDASHVETETVTATHKTTTVATCEETGVETYTATFENTAFEAKTKEIEISALGHDFGAWTELDDNQHQIVCANDPTHVEKEDHNWNAGEVTKEASCTEKGVMTYTCTVCGATKTEDIDEIAHTPEEVAEVPATCVATGTTAGHKCSLCDKIIDGCETIQIDPDAHKPVNVDKVDATCTEDGNEAGTKCYYCGKVLTGCDKIDALGHDWSDWKETKKATVDAEGEETRTCSKCGATETRNTDKLEPTPTPSKAPTATPSAKPSEKPTVTPTKAPAVTLTLDKTKVTEPCGKTVTLKATLKGSSDKITWKSSNKNVASVDANGKVTLKMAGSATITASAAGKSVTCKFQVLYKDVTNSKDFWYTPTYYLTDKDVVKGYANQTEFRPANNCTRAQMVTFIWRLMGEPKPKTTTSKFSDVKKTDYFYKACLWGNENHIVEGYKDGTFGPQIVCARRHAVTFLWRLAGKPNPTTTKNKFSDLKTTDYYYKATLWASEKKILEGYDDGTFRPDGDCLRRQMVTFLYKYDKYINKSK